MKTQFETLKNGKVAVTVWANTSTKEIYPANRNSFGYNALVSNDEFYKKYDKNMKRNAPKSPLGGSYSYSFKSMEEIGFQLVMRGDDPLWN